jgi:hypothetical protein
MKARIWVWLSALVLLLTALLTFLLRDIARDWVALPLARALRFGNLLLGAVPQIVLWGLLLIVGSLVAGWSLRAHRRRSQTIERAQAVPSGQVAILLQWVQRESDSAYFRQRLARRLTGLAAEFQAYRQGHTSKQFDRRLNDLDVPPEIRAYLQDGLTLSPSGSLGRLSRLLRWLRPSGTDSSPGRDLERTVQFLEDQLEVHYGS